MVWFALPALLSGWSGVAIGAGVAAAGAAASHQAAKKRAKTQYDNAMLQQRAMQDQMRRQRIYDESLSRFVSTQADKNKESIDDLSGEMQQLFDASLDRQDINTQQDLVDSNAAKNEAYLQEQSGTEALMLGGQEAAAPEVKQAITKAAAGEASQMRARVAALARFGAHGRDLGLENKMSNADVQSKMGLLGNQMRGSNRLLGLTRGMQPARAYYEPPELLRQGNDAGYLGILGGVGSAAGGMLMGGALGGLAKGAAGAGAPLLGPTIDTGANVAGAANGANALYEGMNTFGGYNNPYNTYAPSNSGWR